MKYALITCHLVAAALIIAAMPAWAEQRIGEVVQREYRGAIAEPNGSPASRAILFQDDVFALDTVKTGATGATALEFLDQTTVEVGAGAQLRLDDFVYDPNTTEGAGQLSFAVGAFRYVGGKMTTEQNIRLHTPTATMVIRGTELVIYVWPDGRTEVNVISGAVEVSACAGGAGKMAMTGMQITVLPNCSTQIAAAPALPAGIAALSLPTREEKDTPEENGGRRGDGKESNRPEGNGRAEGHDSNSTSGSNW